MVLVIDYIVQDSLHDRCLHGGRLDALEGEAQGEGAVVGAAVGHGSPVLVAVDEGDDGAGLWLQDVGMLGGIVALVKKAVEVELCAHAPDRLAGVVALACKAAFEDGSEERAVVFGHHVAAHVGAADEQSLAALAGKGGQPLLHGGRERLVGHQAVSVVALQSEDKVDGVAVVHVDRRQGILATADDVVVASLADGLRVAVD